MRYERGGGEAMTEKPLEIMKEICFYSKKKKYKKVGKNPANA
jgi:hypothetical protein